MLCAGTFVPAFPFWNEIGSTLLTAPNLVASNFVLQVYVVNCARLRVPQTDLIILITHRGKNCVVLFRNHYYLPNSSRC